MTVAQPLPFEQDIHDLEEQLARLEASADAPGRPRRSSGCGGN
jgi:hypothetical protein